MDTDHTEPWITGGYPRDHENFYRKKSITEYSSYVARFSDSPAPVKSQADMILTEVEEQFKKDFTIFETSKKRLEYMKDLYQNCGTISSEGTDTDRRNDRPTRKTNSLRETLLNPAYEDEKIIDDRTASGDDRYCDFSPGTRNIQHGSYNEGGDSGSLKLSARSHIRSARQNVFHDIQDENRSDSNEENSIFEEARSDGGNFDDAERSENEVADDNFEIRRENGITDISSSRQHPYQLHLAEYSKDLQDEWEEESPEVEGPAQPEDGEVDPRESARNRETKKQELFLNYSGSAESVQTTTKDKKSRSEKHRRVRGSVTSTNKKSAAKQIYETIGAPTKGKRKKRKDKTSNSRSTTATREASISETKRDTRKRRQKDNSTILGSRSSHHLHDVATKVNRNWSEMVEIYHNSALKSGSISVVSSKHSRLEPRSRKAGSAKKCDQRSSMKAGRRPVESRDQTKRNRDEIDERRSAKPQENRQRFGDEEGPGEGRICDPASPDVIDLRSGEPNGTKMIFHAECSKAQNHDGMIEEYEYQPRRDGRPCSNNLSPYYDPFATRNYELPTVASKMKRVNRSYFNRFNFRNIPFVVGTSVTPSYNLGLNIQETLSLIKTRQMMPGGATPFLISRVSKGMRPVSTLLGCMRDRDEAPAEETSIRFGVASAAMCNVYPGQIATADNKIATSVQLGPFSLRTPTLSCLHDAQTLYEAQQILTKTKLEDPSPKKRKTQSICSSMKFDGRKNPEGHPELTQSALLRQRQEELNIGDSQSTKWPSAPQKSKGIREVLVNFHDQFEAMQVKYERLQEQAEKSDDKSLAKEIAALEKELNAKEEEINAVVSLYQEVMALKQQMRMLHDRNSLVCVATECPGSPIRPEISARAYTANAVRTINACGRNGTVNNRGPSTSTRLAGLLRQIKTFQKQLKSNS